jgi:tetratricopeptide (TPR) repeat protein
VAEYDRLAKAAPTDYVFPFQMEMIAVLDEAMRNDPTDARAPYYLGNLLFDWQPQQAQARWEKSASLGADFPVVYRNLAMVYTRQGNQRDKARAALEKGLQYGGNAMIIADLDKIYEEDGVSPEKRLAVMETHQSVINRDDVIAREVNLEIFAGKPDAAIKLLQSRFFRAWEGGGRFALGDSWINANLERGHQHMGGKQYAQALADFQAALQVPANLEEATGSVGSRRGEALYWIGCAYQALGDTAKARSAWTEASASAADPVRRPRPGEPAYTGHFSNGSMGGLAAGVHVEQAALYYRAMALEALGQTEAATKLFQQLVDTGGTTTAQRSEAADAHYLAGLGQLGLKHQEQARQEFTLALQASPDHYAAKQALTDSHP